MKVFVPEVCFCVSRCPCLECSIDESSKPCLCLGVTQIVGRKASSTAFRLTKVIVLSRFLTERPIKLRTTWVPRKPEHESEVLHLQSALKNPRVFLETALACSAITTAVNLARQLNRGSFNYNGSRVALGAEILLFVNETFAYGKVGHQNGFRILNPSYDK